LKDLNLGRRCSLLGCCLGRQLKKLMKLGLKLILYISWLTYACKLKNGFRYRTEVLPA